MERPRRIVLFPVDMVILAYLIITLASVVLLYRQIANARVLLFIHLIAPIALLAILRLFERMPPPWRRILRVWYPYLLTPLAYKEAGFLVIGLWGAGSADDWAVRAESLLFGTLPVLLFERWTHPLVTALLQTVYALYYFFPLIGGLGLWLYYRRRKTDIPSSYEQMHYFSFVMCLGFYLSFLGYMLVPVQGPNFFLAAQFTTPLSQPTLTNMMRMGISCFQGDHRDCFPSAHVAVTLLVAWLYWRIRHKGIYVMAPYVGLLIISTMYLRYHYAIDVLAGAWLACVIACAAPRLFRSLARMNGNSDLFEISR